MSAQSDVSVCKDGTVHLSSCRAVQGFPGCDCPAMTPTNPSGAAVDVLAWIGAQVRSLAGGHPNSMRAQNRARGEQVKNAVSYLLTRTAELEAERDALREDAERLDWLDSNNIQKRMGWRVGIAPAGNVSVSSVVFLGSEPMTIRAAIDAARAEAGSHA